MSRRVSDARGEALEQDVSTVVLPFEVNDERIEFECLKNRHSIRTAQRVLAGEVYPFIPAARNVEVVMDVGANCGSAGTFFSVHYPHARVLAFEPGRIPYRVLERNARRRANIESFNVGLFDKDDEVPLYSSATHTGSSSVFPRPDATGRSEPVQLRSTRAMLDEQHISKIDVLKIDTEGCEVPILGALTRLLPEIQVVYLEFHSEEDRKVIDRLLGDTHLLAVARVLFGQGEMVYLSKAVAAAETAS